MLNPVDRTTLVGGQPRAWSKLASLLGIVPRMLRLIKGIKDTEISVSWSKNYHFIIYF